MFRPEAKVAVRNRFDIECRDIRSGEVQKFQAHNIVLDQMWSRLVNFQPFFVNIHFGTGTGELSPERTSLFTHLGTKAASNVSSQRALPTSYRQKSIVLNPEEYVGQEITEVGVAYGSGSTNLVTHAFLEDSEGNPISIVKTDTMVVTIYATIFFELGNLEDMYSGRFRWVMPLTNNELVSYFMGFTYPTQQFRVTRAFDFAPNSHEGVAPTSHGQSSNILVADWIKDVSNKRATTPVKRLGISTGNGGIRGFGLGSSDTAGTFRGQFPIAGVFAGHAIEGEQIGVGDGETTGFNLQWNDPQNLTLYIDSDPVDPEDYDLLPVKQGTNLFLLRQPVRLSGPDFDYSVLIDGDVTATVSTPNEPFAVGIDVGAQYANVKINKFRAYYSGLAGNRQLELHGSNKSDFSESVLITEITGTSVGQWHETTFDPVAYRYYRINKKSSSSARIIREIQIIAAEDQIQFHTPPDEGAVITADYTVPYVPKDSNHVLDLQCAIQYGEGS